MSRKEMVARGNVEMYAAGLETRIDILEDKLRDREVRIRGLAHDARTGIAVALDSDPEHETFAGSFFDQRLKEIRASIDRLTNLRKPMRRPLGKKGKR